MNQQRVCGAGKSRDILGASLNAVLAAVARGMALQGRARDAA